MDRRERKEERCFDSQLCGTSSRSSTADSTGSIESATLLVGRRWISRTDLPCACKGREPRAQFDIDPDYPAVRSPDDLGIIYILGTMAAERKREKIHTEVPLASPEHL